MALRILLISTNRCATPDPVFPLGLAYLAGVLARAGHQTRWHDVLVDSKPLPEVLAEYRPQLVGISIRNIDDVLIRKRETYYNELNSLCDLVHRVAQCPVVLGGSGFSIFPQQLLEYSGADYGICGAGEEPLVALLGRLETSAPIEGIPGLVLRRDGTAFAFAGSHDSGAKNPEHIIRPSHIAAYYLSTGGMLNVQTQRGCACHCCYCTYPIIEGRAHRRQPADAVAEQFAEISRLGARYVFIVDSVFNSSARHVTEICEAILQRGIKISWGCFLRPQGLTHDLLGLMARAGLKHIEFGSDSFSDPVLKAYQKGLTFDEIRHSSELAREAGIDYCHFLIAGGPGETEETLEESYEHSRCLEGAVMMAVVGMRVYPGTDLYRRALAEGRITEATDLLHPTYYLAPELSEEGVFATLQRFSEQSSNWIAGDPAPAYEKLVRRFRQRGVAGPLWSYLPLIQRFWPTGTGTLPGHAAELSPPAAAGEL